MNNFSDEFKQYVKALESGEILVFLFEIFAGDDNDYQGKPKMDLSPANPPHPYARLATHPGGLTVKGLQYKETHAELSLPGSSISRSRSDGKLSLQNVEREHVAWIRQQNIAPWVRIYGLMHSRAKQNNPFDLGPFDMKMGKIKYDEQTMIIPLTINNIFQEPFQRLQFDPGTTPALFA